jgi:hypothetical protein
MGSRASKCVHVLATTGYAPELCAITIPTIKAYAERIGADFNLITERKFPDFPVNYERLQIYEAGKDYEWNFNIDADMVLGKELPDISLDAPKEYVRIVMHFNLTEYFHIADNIYFARDGRQAGIVDAFLMTSNWTHDLWRPLPGTLKDYEPIFKEKNPRRISEYCISQNLAQYGLKFSGAFFRGAQIFHVGYTSGNAEDSIYVARAKAQEWGF